MRAVQPERASRYQTGALGRAGTGAAYPSVEGARIMPPRFEVDRLSEDELEQIRRFIEQADIDELSDEMHALIEKYWPWLLEDVRPRATH